MTDKANLKEETKKHIRGLILSSPVGLTIRELKTDYESFIGNPIPYRQLGYNTLEDFLGDIKDTVCTSYEKGMMVLRAPSDPTTQHIERLVSRQKIPNKKKWAVLRKPPPKRNTYKPPPVVPSQLRYQIQELFKSYSDGLPITHFETCFSRRFGYQLDYKKNRFSTLSEMLESIPAIVKLVPFQNGEVRVVPAKPIQSQGPRRQPSATNLSGTKTVPETPQAWQSNKTPTNMTTKSQLNQAQERTVTSQNVHQSNVPPQPQTSSSTIPSLLNIQTPNLFPGRNILPGQRFQNPPVRYIQSGNMLYEVPVYNNVYIPSSSLQYLQQQSHNPTMAMSQQMPTPTISQQGPLSAVPQQNVSSVTQQQTTPRTTTEREKISDASPVRERHFSGASGNSSGDQSFDSNELMFDDDTGIPAELQAEVQQVLEGKPDGVWASRLLTEYKRKFRKELPFKEQGFHSVVEFVSTLPKSLVRIERPDKKGDWLLIDARLKSDSEEDVDVENRDPATSTQDKRNPREDTTFRESVRQVLQHHPEGIFMQDFPAKYKEMTGKTLREEISYCGSLEKLCISLTDDVLQINYKGDGCLMLFAINSEMSRKFDQLLEPYQPHATQQMMEDDRLPVDAVGPGTYYTQLPLPDHRDYIEIYVSNIVSPGVFWIQFRDKNHTMALEKLMDELELFYRKGSGDQYKIPPSLIAVGQVVAVIFPEDDNWHRGIITSIRTIDFVDVYYVDYGNTCSVHKKNLRLLKSRYLKLPAQAVQARLANIQPVGEKWTEQAKLEMLKICVNKPVIALVTGSRNRVLSVCITDTTSEEDLHVNDHLVSEGYAVFAPDELQKSCVYPENMLEIPDDSLLYGITSTQNADVTRQNVPVATPTRPEAGNSEASGYPSSSEGGSQRFIQPVELTPDICIHVINWEQEPWLVSAEISALFWEDDILRSMLQSKRLLVRKHVLSQQENQALFQELLYYGVKSVTESKTYVTIYSLKRLPELLEMFHHPQPDIKVRVEEIIRDFDANDLYWQGEDPDMAADIQRELEETQLGVDELKLTLQALQFKRKRILQSLLSGTGSETDYVNQLHEVEMQISKTKELMEEVEATLGFEVNASCPSQESSSGNLKVANTSKTVKTNRVAPLIVNPVSPQKRTNVVTCEASSLSNQTSTNTNPTGVMTPEQMLQTMLTAQASLTTTIDPSMYSMMFPMMQNTMMQQMPSLGRGQPVSMPQQGEGQNPQQVLQGLPSMMTTGFANMTSNAQTMNNMNTGVLNMNANMPSNIQNLTPGLDNVNMGIPDIQSLMMMPNLQNLMASGSAQQMPNIPTNPRLQAPQTLPNMTNLQNMTSLQGMPNMANISSLGNMQGLFAVPSVRSGQDGTSQNMALLPELIPLLNNLNMGTNSSQGKQ